MNAAGKSLLSILYRSKVQKFAFCVTALLSFVGGGLFTAGWTRATRVRAESDRLFELMIYHTVPGKVPDLESIFRGVSKLQARYHLNVIGYWVPEDPAWQNTFVYLVAHPSREEAKANWQALHADPAFLPYRKAAEPLIEQTNGEFHVDEIYMRPADFSAMK
jgi:hypothetical protein